MNLGVVTVNIPAHRIGIPRRQGPLLEDLRRRAWPSPIRRCSSASCVASRPLRSTPRPCSASARYSAVSAPTTALISCSATNAPPCPSATSARTRRPACSTARTGCATTTTKSPEGKEFALSVVKRMNELCKDWSTAEGYHYSVYSTPAESLTDRFNRIWTARSSAKWTASPTTTSTPTPSTTRCGCSPRRWRSSTTRRTSRTTRPAASSTTREFPRLQANPKALEAVWDYAYTIGIGYLGTNTPIDRCYECGFEGDFEPTEEGFKCPECGNSDPDRCNVTKRTCGYLGNPAQRPMVSTADTRKSRTASST